MRYKAHVGLVYAHAKGNGCHHHHAFFAQKAVLVRGARGSIKPRVVGQGVNAFLRQCFGNVFNALAALAVNNACVAFVLVANKALELRKRVAFFNNLVADVGAVKAADKLRRGLQVQPLGNVLPRNSVCRGSKRHAWHARKLLGQHIKLAVFGAKIVPPLAYAMRLVNGKQRQSALRVKPLQQPLKARRSQPLGRNVKQSDALPKQISLYAGGLLCIKRGIKKSRSHARFVQRAHLVVHQRHQGRHHHRATTPTALQGNGRNLVTQRLAPASRHKHQCITTSQHRINHGLLLAAKLGVTKHLLENVKRVG